MAGSSYEADEQNRAAGSGVGGAKAGDQGERGTAKHAPGTGPGSRDTSAGPRTERRKAEEERTVHRASPKTAHRLSAHAVSSRQPGLAW